MASNELIVAQRDYACARGDLNQSQAYLDGLRDDLTALQASIEQQQHIVGQAQRAVTARKEYLDRLQQTRSIEAELAAARQKRSAEVQAVTERRAAADAAALAAQKAKIDADIAYVAVVGGQEED
jgi:chromosome segregation ATPase